MWILQAFGGADDERERSTELVADIGEELRLDLVELANALEQTLQLHVLARDLRFLGFLLRDVASFAGQEHHIAVVILNGHHRGIDNDRLAATRAAIDRRVPADELSLGGARDGVAYALVDLRRHLPPEAGPERLALDIRELDAHGIEGDLIDLQYGPVRIEQAHELDHGVQRDARNLLAILLASVGCKELGAVNLRRRQRRQTLRLIQ